MNRLGLTLTRSHAINLQYRARAAHMWQESYGQGAYEVFDKIWRRNYQDAQTHWQQISARESRRARAALFALIGDGSPEE